MHFTVQNRTLQNVNSILFSLLSSLFSYTQSSLKSTQVNPSPESMASEIEKEANEAFLDDNFELAVDLYSQAIDLSPNYAVLFADRAQAHIKLHHYTEAVSDANKAIELDPSMSKAYLRKAIACFELEEYQTAKSALELGASLAQNDARFTNLLKECDAHIAAETSEASVPKESIQIAADKSEPVLISSCETLELPPAKPKYRHGYYQKPEEVVITVFAKGIKAEHVVVEYGEQILSVRIDVPDEDAYHFQCRLFGKIIPDKCKYEVLSTKVEIRLAKADAINWASLEFSKEAVVPQKVSTVSVQSHRPVYPSSKSRAKDWDKLEAEVKKEEKDEKLDGDAAVNKVFRDIYQSADEDMRRAMMKSFVESNGTVLSTNWKDVGSKKVEGSAPSGMEMKKWEY